MEQVQEQKQNIETWDLNFPEGTQNGLVKELRKLDLDSGIKVSGFKLACSLRDYVSRVNNILRYKDYADLKFHQIVNEPDLTYTVIRKK